MNIFKKMFGAKKENPVENLEQGVIVYFRYGMEDLEPMYALEDELSAAIVDANAGEYDGHDVAIDGSDAIFYMYGPDGDRLFDLVRPILEASAFMKGAKVHVQYGPPSPDVRIREVIL